MEVVGGTVRYANVPTMRTANNKGKNKHSAGSSRYRRCSEDEALLVGRKLPSLSWILAKNGYGFSHSMD